MHSEQLNILLMDKYVFSHRIKTYKCKGMNTTTFRIMVTSKDGVEIDSGFTNGFNYACKNLLLKKNSKNIETIMVKCEDKNGL